MVSKVRNRTEMGEGSAGGSIVIQCENAHKWYGKLHVLNDVNVTVKRNNPDLKRTLNKIKEIRERYQRRPSVPRHFPHKR